MQIQAVELQIKTEEYNAETKEQEIDKLEESLQNAEVYSEVEGVVKEVNETPATDANGQPKPFISVLSSGQFRVKGTVSELNIGSLYQGQAVTIHSRVDDTQVWQGRHRDHRDRAHRRHHQRRRDLLRRGQRPAELQVQLLRDPLQPGWADFGPARVHPAGHGPGRPARGPVAARLLHCP